MFESKSPFDEAMSRPFLDEPVKKRWSWISLNSSTSSSSSERRDSGLSVDYRAYEAPKITTEVIDFRSDISDEEEEVSFDLEQGRMVEVDLGLMQERHDDIKDINTSMKHMNLIQKGKSCLYILFYRLWPVVVDSVVSLVHTVLGMNFRRTQNSRLLSTNPDLAQVVESQDEHIDRFESMAIESLDHASAGVSHLLAMQQSMAQASKNRKKMLAATATLLLVVVAAHWFSTCFVQDGDGPPMH